MYAVRERVEEIFVFVNQVKYMLVSFVGNLAATVDRCHRMFPFWMEDCLGETRFVHEEQITNIDVPIKSVKKDDKKGNRRTGIPVDDTRRFHYGVE